MEEDFEYTIGAEEVADILVAGDSADIIKDEKVIDLNATVTDNLISKTDIKWYKFHVPSQGYFSLDFEHEYESSKNIRWSMLICDSNYNQLALYSFNGPTLSYSNGKIGVPSGDYFVKICKAKSYSFSDKTYTFRINYEASNDWEVEFNDTYESANLINSNCKYYGSLQIENDVDWYKCNISENGYLSLDFEHEYNSSNNIRWSASICDSSYTELAKYSFYGQIMENTMGNIGVHEGIYYIKVYKTPSYSQSTQEYGIKLNFTASSEWEKEFNDTAESANVISVENLYSGSLRSNEDIDWYQFSITDPGYISLSFEHEYETSNNMRWSVQIYNTLFEELVEYSFLGQTLKYEKENIGLPAGTFYLKIFRTKNYSLSTKDYKIKINYHSSANWEREFNDTYETSDSILVNQKYYGNIRTNDDIDWYEFSVSDPGYIYLNFEHEYESSNNKWWTVSICNSLYQELTSYSIQGNTTSYTEENIGVPAGVYYLKVNKNKGNLSHSGVDYSFIINYKASNYWEKEFNDSYETANLIDIDKRYSGSIRNSKDVDWYMFTIDSSNAVMEFTHDQIATDRKCWNYCLHNSSFSEIKSGSYACSVTSYTEALSLTSGKYYLKITPEYYSSVNYNIRIFIPDQVDLPAATTISKLSAKSKGFTVKWKKQSDISGYQIQYSTSKSFSHRTTKTIKDAKKDSATYKNLKSNKKYFVRVRTFKTVSGEKYYSGWSKAKTVKTKK